ncbi:hypothetical protein [Hymenobacter cellulosivorans]|uniref:C2H2-type domain-containing protein n=1 Tax=Hymenobacter cellulosivorans TaxID=2932249 RepID=A0ABY4FJG2_9BACT|nr:hypothetical protein [Hymenobacter cellulosivorans]UOQ54596.1 hypothetical protein MUN80_07485 [Hymenobacter cellulosivorans]
MPTLFTDLEDLLAFGMLSAHTLDILQHKYGVSEGDLFSAVTKVVRQRRADAEQPEMLRELQQKRQAMLTDARVCRHCGEAIAARAAMRHLWQAHDIIARTTWPAHYSASSFGTPAEVGSGTEAAVAPTNARRYLVRSRGYTIMIVSERGLNNRYRTADLKRDNQRQGFRQCLRGTFILVPMRA